MDERTEWEALARYVAGESSPAEQWEIQARARVDPRRRRHLELARRIWRVAGRAARRWDARAAWLRFLRSAPARVFGSRVPDDPSAPRR